MHFWKLVMYFTLLCSISYGFRLGLDLVGTGGPVGTWLGRVLCLSVVDLGGVVLCSIVTNETPPFCRTAE